MLDLVVLAAGDRLLASAPWARARLVPFAGRRARLVLGPLTLDFRIAADGGIESLGSGRPEVEITLPLAALWRLPQGRGALLAEARVSGSAEFAEALGFVLRHLEWDAEETLSRFLGDIAAHRLAGAAHGLAAAAAEAARRLADNLDEYRRHERRPSL